MKDGEVYCSKCKGKGIDPDFPNEECHKCSGLKKLDWITNATGQAFNRQEKSMLFVIKTLNELVKKGILTQGGFQLSSKAEEAIKGFKPTDIEIQQAMAILKNEGYIG
ncbi:MAG: hypothetical protein ACFFG0_00640 [Candidatus Thorarchaeota archaeon]